VHTAVPIHRSKGSDYGELGGEVTIVGVGEEMMCKYKEPETVFAINSLPMPVSSDKRSIGT